MWRITALEGPPTPTVSTHIVTNSLVKETPSIATVTPPLLSGAVATVDGCSMLFQHLDFIVQQYATCINMFPMAVPANRRLFCYSITPVFVL